MEIIQQFLIIFFNTTFNPNLTCITVDDEAWSTTNWTNIDNQTSFSVDCDALSIDEFSMKNVKVYPNPVIDELMINLTIEGNYSVYDVFGKIVDKGILNNGNNQVHLNHLQSGVYLISIETGKGKIIKKIIKR